MPYSASSANRSALRRILDIYWQARSIEVLHKSSTVSASIQQMLFQSAMVMACATLEQYLVSFFDEWLNKLQRENAKFKDIPPTLKTYFLMRQQHPHMKNLVANGEEMKYIRETEITKSYYAVHNDRRLIKGVSEFRDFKFYAKDSFPTESNIRKLFSIIGYTLAFRELNNFSKKNLNFLLKSFLDVRNSIAHRQAPDLTMDDMSEHLRVIWSLINNLDKVLYTHLTSTADPRFWPGA